MMLWLRLLSIEIDRKINMFLADLIPLRIRRQVLINEWAKYSMQHNDGKPHVIEIHDVIENLNVPKLSSSF